MFLDWLEDGYQIAVVHGALAAAKDAGATLLCASGGVLGSPLRCAPQRNHVFSLLGPRSVDGLIILSGALINHVGPEAFTSFCRGYQPLPMSSIAVALPGIPSVLLDNDAGLRSVVEHFIRVHGYRRIAFVRGPPANEEAERRFRAYQEILADNGIAIQESLVAIGDFQATGGQAAVSTWLDERGLKVTDIDAIVAANDQMALGVLEALRQRNIRVPTDVALAGFDDVEEARFTQPPLTTVRQPLEEQGRAAVRLVMSQLLGRSLPENVVLRTELVVRESCGCFAGGHRPHELTENSTSFGFEASLLGRRQRILDELTRTGRGELAAAGPGWEARLLSAAADELRGAGDGLVLAQVKDYVERLVARGADTKVCHEILTCLRSELLPCLLKEPERRERAEDLFQQARLGVSTLTERELGRSRLRLEHWVRQLSSVAASLIGAFGMRALRDAIHERFPDLGIKSCFILRYVETTPEPSEARLVLAYDALIPHANLSDQPFPVAELLPSELLMESNLARSYVVGPVFFGQEILGYMLVELDVDQGFAYEAVRDLVSAALKGADLVERQLALEERNGSVDRTLQDLHQRLRAGQAVPADELVQILSGLLSTSKPE